MADCVDVEARGQIGELRSDLTSLATDYWGKDGNNGHRSRSVLAQKRLDVLERECDHYQDKVRRETCYGLEGLKKHEESHDKFLAEIIVKRIAEVNEEVRRNKTKLQVIGMLAPYFGTLAALLIAFKDVILKVPK